MRRINRREFASHAGLAFLTGVTVSISNACGGGGYSSTPSTTPPATNPPTGGDKQGQISDNHGHVATITAAQVDAAGAINGLNIQGSAGHGHMISLSTPAMAEIKANRPVETMSTSGDGHTHLVTFNASATEPPTRY
jgi:hypothetical protein